MIFDFRGYNRLTFLILAIIMLMGLTLASFAQAPDLDLVEERLLSVAVSAADGAEFRAVSVVAPWSFINGGAFVYGTQTLVGEARVDALQWRLQGGPVWRGMSLQFYVDSVYEKRLDYAWFYRPGLLKFGEVSFSGGLGTLLRQDTREELGEADAVGDRKVKGLLFVSGHYERGNFDVDARATFVPGFDGEHDLTFEPSVTLDYGRFSLTGNALFGYTLGMFDRDYTVLLNVPF
ncbi:hypothetical protein F4Y93_03935 [Candidatus Poribacteria bacterium]|nr:hypothetical protein [Candidatus Poribacteria bacterium]